MKTLRSRIALVTVVLSTVTFAHLQVADAQSWNFETCDTSQTTVVEHTPPAVMLMLDKSGSMSSRGEPKSDGGRSRWQIAVAAINGAVNELAADMHFGLGFFHGSQAYIVEEATKKSAPKIPGILASNRPGGGTPMWQAIEEIRDSDTMTDSSRASAGVLITDGSPTTGISQPITQACAMRDDDKQTLFVVGFSSGTDEKYNNKMAAAGGMRYTNSAGQEIIAGCSEDPCVRPGVSKNSCTGSIQANSATQFQNALSTITNELQCVFPVDTSLHPEGGAPTDFNALRVKISGTMGADVTLRHKDHPLADPPGEGWYYPVPTNPNQIRLTEHYCEKARNRELNEVETRLACPCDEAKVGQSCFDPDRDFNVCKEGKWACDNGFDYCEPLPLPQCEEKCPGWDAGELCHMSKIPGEVSSKAQKDLVEAERTRCLIGLAVCDEANHEPSCVRLYDPMPETCSGLDDDCDGLVDNLNESWAKDKWEWRGKKYNWAKQEWEDDIVSWKPADLETPEQSVNPKDRPEACFGEDLCRCRGKSGEHQGLSPMATPVDQFAEYLEKYTPGTDDEGCICVEN